MHQHAPRLGIALLGLVALGPFIDGHRQAPAEGQAPLRIASRSLLGADGNELLARLGPPISIWSSQSGWSTWIWSLEDGSKPRAMVYEDVVVTLVPRTLGDGLEPVGVPEGRVFLGLRVEDVLALRGHPDKIANRPVHSMPGGGGEILYTEPVLVYGAEGYTLSDGRVVRISEEPPKQVIHGPR